MSRSKSRDPDFEASMAELEQIVQKLEQGELSLDDSLQQFERGVALARQCQTALQAAEQRVQILTRAASAEPEVRDLPADED